MRKITYSRLVPSKKQGVSHELAPDQPGTFHGFGIDSNNQGAAYTVAIVETPEGQLELVNLALVQFSPAPAKRSPKAVKSKHL